VHIQLLATITRMERNFFSEISVLSSIKSEKLTDFKNVDEYEKCLLHIESLINSSILLYKNKFFNQSLFITISTIEEIAKAEVCLYRGLQKESKTNVKRRKDGLYSHKTKHIVSANEITFKYLKSEKRIGKNKISIILNNLNNGTYSIIREKSLYFENIDGICKTPLNEFTEIEVRDLLLICIELFEDRLFGAYAKTDIITDRVLLKLNEI
jgi:AbiV family abortive infection protein